MPSGLMQALGPSRSLSCGCSVRRSGCARARTGRSLHRISLAALCHRKDSAVTTRPVGLLAALVAIVGAALGVAGPAQAATPAGQITKVYYNSPGTDTGSNTSLNAEWV